MTISTVQAAMSGVEIDLLTAVTTGTGTPIAIPSSFRNHTILCKAATGVTAGTIVVEASNDPNDAGTWALLNTFTIAAAGDQIYQNAGLLQFVRARVTTNVSGGGAPSATVTYTGAKSY